MHELSLIHGLIQLVGASAAANGLRRVRRVEVGVGEWSGVCPEAMSFAFRALARGPLWDGAKLELKPVASNDQVLVAGYEGE